MKIDYKILWLDNEMNAFIEDDVILEIEQHLISEGFLPTIITTSDEDDFLGKLNDSYDLILTDYHLNNLSGADIINEIRKPERSIFTEILFYTAKAELTDTHKISRVSFLETNGKSATHQETIIAEVKKLIDLTIRKFHHIVAMRGMIMHETSLLDSKMLDLILGSLNRDNINFKDLAESIYDQLLELYSTKAGFVNTCKEKSKFKELTKDTFVFSSDYKIQTLKQIIDAIGEVTDFSADYKEEIISIRNKFAHANLLVDDQGREYFKYKEGGITFDEALCKKIRRDIFKHQKNLDALENRLAETNP
ncbi:response regulator [Flavobacterium sp. 3HN19-14]|uniref:response regulator n=1 Tax=Flavobacterium sp. 3HN19-14 TaxID=3448133 RepID=UPI003EE2C2B7